ncbi:MAG TPA: BON domain-containing protein [Terracidiphilus sp.]|nr:BON domain-containing protein [Terracidiphilus sp.]
MNLRNTWLTSLAILALTAGLATGCKKTAEQQAARTDQQVTSDIQAKIQGESALNGQNIQVSVANGVATLSGTVADDASRALAGNDTGAVDGVKTVVNNLTVQPVKQPGASASAPMEQRRPAPERMRRSAPPQQQPSRAEASMPSGPPPPSHVSTPVPPPTPMPTVRQISLPAGTQIPVRIAEAIDSKTAQPNDSFHASVAKDVIENGLVVIPRGSPVLGTVTDARGAAHFKGTSLLTIQITQLTTRGQKVDLSSDTYSKEGKARGKNTAAKAGGGAVLGAIVGAIAGGGKGAAIGAAAGGGAGAGINAITRGEEVQIPSESIVDFRLQSPITVNVTILPSGQVDNSQSNDPQLKQR